MKFLEHLTLYLSVYRVTHFNRQTEISPRVGNLQKKYSYESYSGQWGSTFGTLGFDLENIFQGHFNVMVIFLNGNPYFLLRNRKERETL